MDVRSISKSVWMGSFVAALAACGGGSDWPNDGGDAGVRADADGSEAAVDAAGSDSAAEAGSDAGDAGNGGDAGSDAGNGGDAGSDASDAGDPGDGGCSASLHAIQTNIFAVRCAGSRCHNAGFDSASLDLTATDVHGQLVGVHSVNYPADIRVVPGDLNQSFLYRKLTNMLPTDQSEGVPMPNGEAIRWIQIPDAELNQIRCWILSGAPDN